MKNIVSLVLLFYITMAYIVSAQVSNDIFPAEDNGSLYDDNGSLYYGNDSSYHDVQNYTMQTENGTADTNVTIDASNTIGTANISYNDTNSTSNIAVSNDSEITIKVYRNPGQFLIFEILLVLSVVIATVYMLRAKWYEK
jgi:hypothetical protein